VLALVLLAAAAPAKEWTVTLHHLEKLVVKTRRGLSPDNTTLDAVAKVKIVSMSGGRPDAVTVEPLKHEFPKATVREDSGAPVVLFENDAPPPIGSGKTLKRVLGRLVVDDREHTAMSSCTADTEAATNRYLKEGIARINGSDPSEVSLSEVTVKCTPTKSGTRLDVAFSAKVPRGTMEIVLQCKGTLTLDKALWLTQWKIEGPVHASTPDAELSVDGSFSSSMSMSR
jgi:hypothetical protein